MKKSVLISGVSTGIGYHLLKVYSERDYQVFGSVRKQNDAEQLLEEFPEFTPLLFDVTDNEAIKAAVTIVEKKLNGQGLGILINNAGVAVSGPLMLLELEEFQRQFDINVFGLLRLTKACLPLLGASENLGHPPGKILNISSISGKVGYPFLGAYASSKHAVEGLSHSLRRELLPFGIDVILIAPGSIKTPIWEKESATVIPEKIKTSIFGKYVANFQKMMHRTAKRGLDPYQFAKQVVDISEKSKPKTRYAFAKNYLTDWILPRYVLPDRVLDQMIQRELEK